MNASTAILRSRPRPAFLALSAALLAPACSRGPEGPAQIASAAPRSAPAASEPAQAAGHERMLAILAEIARKTEDVHPFLSTTKLRALRAQQRELAQAPPPDDPQGLIRRWRLNFDLGNAELAHGNEERAIRCLRSAHEFLPRLDFTKGTGKEERKELKDPDTYYANATRLRLGVAYLRLGEKQNCCLRHTGESCILPIRGSGIHTAPEGSREALRCFLEVLEHRPAKPEQVETVDCARTAQWLLNVAAMTLGEYPDGVPREYLVSLDALFRCEIDFPRFENVLPELDLDTFDLSGGAIVDDFDGDDYLDIVTSSWDTRGQMHYFHSERDGTFRDLTAQAGLTGFFGGLNMVQADYDNDGDVDIYVLRGAWLRSYGAKHPNSLLRNDGRGRFTDVTFEAGLGAVHYPNKTGAWGDYDLDGDLDLFVGTEATKDLPAAVGQLYRNDGDGTFTEVGAQAGVAESIFAMGSSWGDYDGDRFPDLYVTTGYSDPTNSLDGAGPNKLYHNQGDGTFRDVAPELGVVEPMAAFPCWFWDFDNDGCLDIYASCSSGPVAMLVDPTGFATNRLYRGDGRGGFRDVTRECGLDYPTRPMGANFGDLNGDGWLDFYLSTGNVPYSELHPNVMFAGLGGKSFTNVTMKGGFGHLQKGHGVAFADLDNDGDCDVYVQMGGALPADKFSDALFENPGFGSRWLTLALEGRRSNRSAIGTHVRVDLEEDGRARSVHRWVNSGGSFGCNPLRQTIGLGRATGVKTLSVYWPTSDLTQVFEDVPLDQAFRIVEGEDRLVPIPLQRLHLGGERTGPAPDPDNPPGG